MAILKYINPVNFMRKPHLVISYCRFYTLYSLLIITCVPTKLNAEIHNYDIVQADHNAPITEITAMVNAAYTKTLWLKPGVQRIQPSELAAMIQKPTKKLFLCLDNKTICGAVLLDLSSAPEMSMLAVHPKYQGQKIGTMLMQHIERELVKLGHNYVLIYVVPFGQDQLVAYYLKAGYYFLDKTLPFTHLQLVKQEYQDQVFLRIMRKDLKGEI